MNLQVQLENYLGNQAGQKDRSNFSYYVPFSHSLHAPKETDIFK